MNGRVVFIEFPATPVARAVVLGQGSTEDAGERKLILVMDPGRPGVEGPQGRQRRSYLGRKKKSLMKQDMGKRELIKEREKFE